MDRRYLESSLGQSARFVEHQNLRAGQRLQIVAALDQNPRFGSAADPAEKA